MFAADACRRDLESLRSQIKNVFDLSEFLLGMKNPFISSAALGLSEVHTFVSTCVCTHSPFSDLDSMLRHKEPPPPRSRVVAQLVAPSAAARRRFK